MIGKILISDVKVQAVVGVTPREREKEQELIIDLQLKSDFSTCVQTDAIEDTIDYDQVRNALCRVAQSKPFHLLETLAHETLEVLFGEFPIKWAKILVKKLAISSAVELERP